jgi:hypothetical protein
MRGINSSRASLAMSATALFVTLGGTAVAASRIGTSQLQNGAVTKAKLHKAAVTNGKLAAKAVGTGKLADGAVTTSKLHAGAVGPTQLGAAAVGTANLAGGAVTSADLAPGSVGAAALAPGSVGTSALANTAVTSTKLADNAVTSTKLADNAVTSAKVADGSLTASDVATGTFLPAGGTAVNSTELGGVGPAGYVRGAGRLMSNRVVVPVGSTVQLLELDFAHVDGVCEAGAIPVQRLVAELPLENVIYSAVNFGNTTDVDTSNALAAGTFLEATHTTTTPQTVTWQAAFNDGTDQLATAWTTGQDEGGTCVFTGQAITTLG